MPEQHRGRGFADMKQKKKDYIDAFSSGAGKRVLADLEHLGYINRTTYSHVPGRMQLNEGMRFLVVHIKNMMSMDIEQLEALMQKGDEPNE